MGGNVDAKGGPVAAVRNDYLATGVRVNYYLGDEMFRPGFLFYWDPGII